MLQCVNYPSGRKSHEECCDLFSSQLDDSGPNISGMESASKEKNNVCYQTMTVPQRIPADDTSYTAKIPHALVVITMAACSLLVVTMS